MSNYDIQHTFSNEESVECPPPPPSYPYEVGDEEALANDIPTIINDLEKDLGKEVEKEVDSDLGNDLGNDLELNANDDEFERTLSQLDFSVKSYRENDSLADTTVESEEESVVKESGNPFTKKRNLLGLLALALVVIAASLGAASRSRKNNNGDVAISQANSAVTESAAMVAPTETLEETSAEASAEKPRKDSTEDQTNVSIEDLVADEVQEAAETPTTGDESGSEKAEDSKCSTIYELACSTEGLETLCALIAGACTTPGLETVCNAIGELEGGQGSYTVFAPNNSAFDSLPARLKTAIQNPLALSDTLLYHLIDGEVFAKDLVCGANLPMANTGLTMTMCDDNGHFFQTGTGNFDVFPKIVTADVNACDGVIHVVDQVILQATNPNRPPAWLSNDGFPFSELNDGLSTQSPGSDLDTPEQIFGDVQTETGTVFPQPDDMTVGVEQISGFGQTETGTVVPQPDDMTVGVENQDAGACQEEFSVSKDCYSIGESIEIKYKFCTPSANNWLGVFQPESSDMTGQMRQRAAYWEMPCGGHNLSCPEPLESGTFTMIIQVPPGRYQVHNIGDTNPPYFSTAATVPFVVANQCQGTLPSSESPLTPLEPVIPNEPLSSDEPMPLEPVMPKEPLSSDEPMPWHDNVPSSDSLPSHR
eukprot:CAMPEP_0197175942 /NCGR_PEP_ID=MMETSP1423-20130617/2020_1 /TAXON_ID=476441 /ORGANISM="Pseudo-nitzschia heimii, Strain UNC1101" /LENGTH=650 /DNA_ID=CAMNT_0042625213 /DNA_START=20 /DNA_END=1972 /DNA_ORIENTATION=-